jgi:hypothetical protein
MRVWKLQKFGRGARGGDCGITPQARGPGVGSVESPVSVFAFLAAGSAPADDPDAEAAPLLSSGAFFFLPNTPWIERERG